MAEAIEACADTIADPGAASRACKAVATALQRHPPRAFALIHRLADKVPPAGASDADAKRWNRHRALVAFAGMAAQAGELAAAAAALAEARRLADPAWPAVRVPDLGQSEANMAAVTSVSASYVHWTRRFVELLASCGDTQSYALTTLVDAELAAGHAERAVEIGNRAVTALAGGRDENSLAFARLNLAAVLLSLDRWDQALAHLRAGWAQAVLFDVQPFFADYLALLAAMQGRPEAAARLSGFADAANARVGPREPNEAAAIARATQLARAALGDATFERLHAEGALLRDADIADIAALAFPVEPHA